MIIKVCGLRHPDNIREVARAGPDMMGFIFYPASARYAGKELEPALLKEIPVQVKKTGVFVNAPLNEMLAIREKYSLDFLQLHGEESPETCRDLKAHKIRVIKAFQVPENFDFSRLSAYASSCEMFLFDSPGTGRGGSGKTFAWEILTRYRLDTPFLLSGGIGPGNIDRVLSLDHPAFAGVDLNSRLEIRPGYKSVEMTSDIIQTIRNYERHSSR